MSRELDRLEREITHRTLSQKRRRERLRRHSVQPGLMVPAGLALGFVGGLCFFGPRSRTPAAGSSSPQRIAQDMLLELLDRQLSRWMFMLYARSRSRDSVQQKQQ